MPVRVEFYGIARARAGVPFIEIEAATLGDVFRQISLRGAAMNDVCSPEGSLQPGFLVNINGRSFTTDAAKPVSGGDAVLILSADAGG